MWVTIDNPILDDIQRMKYLEPDTFLPRKNIVWVKLRALLLVILKVWLSASSSAAM
jgi:hypothetical protein